MTYENLVKEAKKAAKMIDTKSIKEHLAVEIDIEGKGEGAFYVEFSEKVVEVEPYEYYDHDFRIRTDAVTALAILKGEVAPTIAKNADCIRVEGNEYKLALLEEYLSVEEKPKKAAAKKTPAKKAPAKKPVPKKVAKKPAAKTGK